MAGGFRRESAQRRKPLPATEVRLGRRRAHEGLRPGQAVSSKANDEAGQSPLLEGLK
jgi:hypothetical protein